MRKNWRGGGKSLLKNGAIDLTLTKHVIPRPNLYCAGFWHFEIFAPKAKKKILLPDRGALALCHLGKSGTGYFITIIKGLDEGLR